MTVAMALAEQLSRAVNRVERDEALRRQTTRASEEDAHAAPRAQETPPRGMRSSGETPLSLADAPAEAIDCRTLRYLLKVSLARKKKEEEKERKAEEEEHEKRMLEIHRKTRADKPFTDAGWEARLQWRAQPLLPRLLGRGGRGRSGARGSSPNPLSRGVRVRPVAQVVQVVVVPVVVQRLIPMVSFGQGSVATGAGGQEEKEDKAASSEVLVSLLASPRSSSTSALSCS